MKNPDLCNSCQHEEVEISLPPCCQCWNPPGDMYKPKERLHELKSCPFCNGIAAVHYVDVTGCYDRSIKYNYQPGCETEGCPGEYGGCSYSTIDEATIAWNTRTQDPLIEELAEKIADHYCKDALFKEMAEALEEIVRCLSHGLQDSRASIAAKDMLQKYHEQIRELK